MSDKCSQCTKIMTYKGINIVVRVGHRAYGIFCSYECLEKFWYGTDKEGTLKTESIRDEEP